MKLQQQFRSARALRLVGLVACGALLFLCGFAICPPAPTVETSATAGDAKAATNSVELSIGDGGTLSFDLKPFSADGTFAESSEITISASTDSYSGYTLSIAAQSGDNTTKLINTDTVNCPVTETKCSIAPLPSTLNGGILKSDYVDPASSEDVNVSINTVRNTWGFSPSVYLSSGANTANRGQGVDEKYFPMSTAAMNFAKTSGPNPNEGGSSGLAPDEYKMKIGARVDTSIPMGTYKNNTFVITAVGNGASYSITYLDATNEGSGIPGVQSGTVYDTTVTLSNASPTRAGYYFGGWCSVSTTDGSCSGTPYARGASFGIDQTASSNTATLYAMWALCPVNTVCYDDNGASSTTKMNNQGLSAAEITNGEFNLRASNFKRSGYGFIGWSEKANPNISTDKIYGPMETVNKSLAYGGLKLYAIWKEAAKDGSNNPIYFQDWQTQNGCNNLKAAEYSNGALTVTSNTFTALTDKRDGQVYAVAKLADGNCWMIENLRLESAGTLGNNIIDQNVTNQSLAQGYGGVFNGLADAETANFSNSTAVNKIGNTVFYGATDSGAANIIDTASHTYDSTDYTGYYFPRYRNNNTNLADNYATSDNSGNTYAYGNYYTWTAAMANTTFYRSYDGAAGTDTGSDAANTSICPSGWRLPLGASRNTINLSFSKLDYSMGGSGTTANANTDPTGAVRSKAWRSFPNNFLYSGNAYDSSIVNRGSYGYYWSSSASNAYNAYNLGLNSSTLLPGTSNSTKFYGFTVRCVLGS